MSFVGYWHHLDVGIKAALISAVSTLMAAFFGFGAVIIQIRAQGSQARRTIVDTEKRKLKAAIYEDALLVCRAMSDVAIELSTALRIMDVQLRMVDSAVRTGTRYVLPSTRWPFLAAKYERFTDATIKVVFLIENRRIIDPRLLIFRTALSTVLHDTRQLMFSGLYRHLLQALPVDGPEGGVLPYPPPKLAEINTIKILSDKMLDALGDGTAYSEDLMVELQNLLLGDLFGHKLLPRNPLDPTKKVVTLEQADELEKWFVSSTPWGEMKTATEKEVRRKYEKNN